MVCTLYPVAAQLEQLRFMLLVLRAPRSGNPMTPIMSVRRLYISPVFCQRILGLSISVIVIAYQPSSLPRAVAGYAPRSVSHQ